MKTGKSRRPLGLWLLIVALFLLGVGGLYGGLSFLTDPTGASMGLTPDILARLPVPDYTLPGIFLLVVMGLGPLVILYGLLAQPRWTWTDPLNPWSHAHWSWTAALLLGIVLGVWLIFEGLLIQMIAPIQVFTGALGVIIVAMSLLPSVRRYYRQG